MKRYLNSFLITLILYSSVVFAFFIIFSDKKIIMKKDKPAQQTISLKHIELIPIPKVEKKKEIKQVVKKVKKKKIVKKTKKVVKKKIIKKKVIKQKQVKKLVEKELVKEPFIEKPKEEVISKEIVKEKTSKIKDTKKVVKTDHRKEYLSKHLSLIRKYIKQNVHYPKSAKRLNIEGIVKVKFTLHSNGIVDNIVILSGHKRLKKSTINAVKYASSSFPKVKKDITISLPIEYKLI